MGYLVPIAVIDSSVKGLFIYDVDSDWNDEQIEHFINTQGRRPSECSWGVFDGDIDDFRGEKLIEYVTVRSKGELMKEVYTEEENRRVDSAIPIAYWDGKNKDIQVDPGIHVYDYNEPNTYGALVNLEERAQQQNKVIVWETYK